MGCLRCLFIFFNMLFVMQGFAHVAGTIWLKLYLEQYDVAGEQRVLLELSWAFSLTYLFLSSLAVYGGCAENKCVLQLFSVLMLIITLGLVTIGIHIINSGPDETGFPAVACLTLSLLLCVCAQFYFPFTTEYMLELKSRILPLVFGMAFIALCGMTISMAMARQISSHQETDPVHMMRWSGGMNNGQHQIITQSYPMIGPMYSHTRL